MTLAALSPISGIAPFGGGWLAGTGDYLIGSAAAPVLLGDGGDTNNTAGRPVDPQALAGAGVQAFVADFYDRLHITETTLSLGNVVGLQSRTIGIWNAYRRTRLGGPSGLSEYDFTSYYAEIETLRATTEPGPKQAWLDALQAWGQALERDLA